MLVRGVAKYSNFGEDVGAKSDLDPATLLNQKELEKLYKKTVDVKPAYWRFKSFPRKQLLLIYQVSYVFERFIEPLPMHARGVFPATGLRLFP